MLTGNRRKSSILEEREREKGEKIVFHKKWKRIVRRIDGQGEEIKKKGRKRWRRKGEGGEGRLYERETDDRVTPFCFGYF